MLIGASSGSPNRHSDSRCVTGYHYGDGFEHDKVPHLLGTQYVSEKFSRRHPQAFIKASRPVRQSFQTAVDPSAASNVHDDEYLPRTRRPSIAHLLTIDKNVLHGAIARRCKNS